MAGRNSGPRKPAGQLDSKKLDGIVAKAHKERDVRMAGYRERSLKIHPWVCGRCGRTFTRENLHELTVHHKDHNHDNNPPDGGNWELLCLYCHDNEHQEYLDEESFGEITPGGNKGPFALHKPFAALEALLKDKKK